MGQRNLLDWQKRLLNAANKSWLGLSFVSLIVLLLYIPSLNNWGAVDDLIHLEAALFHESPTTTFFRPLERWTNETNVDLLGYGDLRFALGINLVGLLATVLATYLLGRTVFSFRGARLVSLFAATAVAVSSLAVTTTAQIDTISQQFASLFPLLFVLTLVQATRRSSPNLFILAFGFASLALLSKETTLGLLAVGPVATHLLATRSGDSTARHKGLALLANYGVLAVLVVAYLAVRVATGYSFSSDAGQYDLALSLPRLVKNVALYFSGLIYVGGSTLDIFPEMKPWRFVASGLLSTLLLSVAGLSVVRMIYVRAKEVTVLLALLLLTLAGSVPVIVTEQVSELYVYSSLPYYALLIGMGFISGCRQLMRQLDRPRVFGVAAGISCGLFVWMIVGSYGKLRALGDVSDQSQLYFIQAKSFIERAPNQDLNLCWASTNRPPSPAYSVFVVDPQLLASRALTFAINIRQREVNPKRVLILDERSESRSCDYEMTLTAAGLQFETPS